MIQKADFMSVNRAFARFKKEKPNCIKSKKLSLKIRNLLFPSFGKIGLKTLKE